MEFQSIGKYIRKFRLEKGFRQEDLAERTGLSEKYIGMVERGEKTPALESFIHIVNALGVSADMLLTDVVNAGYTVKCSLLTERMEKLSVQKREMVYDVIDALIRHLSTGEQ